MPRILIVDDDDVDREAASRCLRSFMDLEIAYARDGLAALEEIAAKAPDLILTDLRMPRMDGLQLVEAIQTDFPLIPVILMTSQGNEQIAVRALRGGAASYVPKSELKRSLSETVEQVLEISEARRSRSAVLGYLSRSETSFDLDNDPALIVPLVGFLQENMARAGLGDEGVRTQVGMALMEAVTNGMVHGNLEVASEVRRTDRDGYMRLIEERRREEPYAARRLRCSATESKESIEYVVTDEGPGFDPSRLPDPTAPENVLAVSGRGIYLMRTFMDAVRYNDRGNQVTLTKSLRA